MRNLISILAELAVIPSFSSYEERIHPVILEQLGQIENITIYHVPDNNLVAFVEGDSGRNPVALTAHLDKINHFGEHPPEKLPFQEDGIRVTGQMDNTAGLAICIAVARQASRRSFPPLLLLFSEMEESYGLKHHPRLLKNEGKGLHHGIGAGRISRYLSANNMLPSVVLTVDTTPLFKGEKGVALYSEHWAFTKCRPGEKERQRTIQVRDELLEIDPNLRLSNNTNDYLHYGVELNKNKDTGIPSLAIEPAIFPYHKKNESVFLDDIERVYRTLIRWLEKYG